MGDRKGRRSSGPVPWLVVIPLALMMTALLGLFGALVWRSVAAVLAR